MNEYTDTQLKRALAKMLPEMHTLEERPRTCSVTKETFADFYYHFGIMSWPPYRINDTELLHLVSLVETALKQSDGLKSLKNRHREYLLTLMQSFAPDKKLWNNGTFLGSWADAIKTAEATWEQRVIAMAKVLNVEIV